MHDCAMKSRGVRSFAAGVVAVLVLSACGAGDDGGGDDTDDGGITETPSETTATPTDDGEELTEPGTELQLGDSAFIRWNATQQLEGYVAVTVQRLVQVSIQEFRAFKLDEDMQKSTPYYVTVSVANLGKTNLAGVRIPLYLNDGSEVLIPQANIPTRFDPCPSEPLPKKFTKDKQVNLCLVYLAPEGRQLEAMALRSADMTDAISWTGKITKPGKGGDDKGKKGDR